MEDMMNKELIEALDALEKEKEISKEKLLSAIETSLLTACKNHFAFLYFKYYLFFGSFVYRFNHLTAAKNAHTTALDT